MKTIYIKRNDLFKDINMVLCNNIDKIDDSFVEDNLDLFYYDCDECDGTGEIKEESCEECSGEGKGTTDPYQYFLCNIDEYTKERLKEFGVDVGYSETLDLEVIPIYDFGTSWSMFSYSREVEDDYVLGYNETLTRLTHY